MRIYLISNSLFLRSLSLRSSNLNESPWEVKYLNHYNDEGNIKFNHKIKAAHSLYLFLSFSFNVAVISRSFLSVRSLPALVDGTKGDANIILRAIAIVWKIQ